MESVEFPQEGPVLIAHRAGNTVEGLRAAERGGADMVEADVFLRNGRFEVRHSKTMGRVPVLWDRWRLERGWGERFLLPDLLDAASRETVFMIDIKRNAAGLPGELASTMARSGRPYLVCSQAWEALEPLEDVPLATPVYSVGGLAALARFIDRFEVGAGVMCSIHERLLNERSSAALVERTSLVMSWPVNNRERMGELLAMGVRGMITDRLEALSAARS